MLVVCFRTFRFLTAAAIGRSSSNGVRRAGRRRRLRLCRKARPPRALFPDVPHTWARLREGTFCGGGLVSIKPRSFPRSNASSNGRRRAQISVASRRPVRLGVLARYAAGRCDRPRRDAGEPLLGAPVHAHSFAVPETGVNVDRSPISRWRKHSCCSDVRLDGRRARRSRRAPGPRRSHVPPTARRSARVAGTRRTPRPAGRPHRDLQREPAGFVYRVLAALQLGAVAVPINVLYRASDLSHVLSDAQPSLVVCSSASSTVRRARNAEERPWLDRTRPT